MDCCEMLYKHSLSPDDKALRHLVIFFFKSATVVLTFLFPWISMNFAGDINYTQMINMIFFL